MAEDTKQFDIQPHLINGYNQSENRLVNIASGRKTTETDFLNSLSMDYQKSLYSNRANYTSKDPKLY